MVANKTHLSFLNECLSEEEAKRADLGSVMPVADLDMAKVEMTMNEAVDKVVSVVNLMQMYWAERGKEKLEEAAKIFVKLVSGEKGSKQAKA